MPVMESPYSISDMAKEARKSTDKITQILRKETRPSQSDINQSMLENVRASAGMGTPRRSTEEVFQQRRAMAIQPEADIVGLFEQASKAGSEQAKSLMSTFSEFADNSEDLAKLVAAANDDPEEITPLNAATWAARKSKELGLRSVAKMQAENQAAYARAKLAGKPEKPSDLPSWVGGGAASGDGGSMPMDMPTDQEMEAMPSTSLLPPPSTTQTAEVLPPPAKKEPAEVKTVNISGVDVRPEVASLMAQNASMFKSREELYKYAINAMKLDDNKAVLEEGRIANKFMQNADTAYNQINKLVSEGKSTGIVQGTLGKIMNNPQFELIEASGAGLAMTNRVPGTGAVSDYDAKQLRAQVMSGDKSVPANLGLIAVTKARMKNASDYAQFFRWWINNTGSANGAELVWEQFRNQTGPMVTKGANGMPVITPAYDANWKDFVAGRAAAKKEEKKTSPSAPKKPITEMTDEELDAYEKSLMGQ